ncbi:MAG: alpha-L-fucosidase [Bacteroidales bacterium]
MKTFTTILIFLIAFGTAFSQPAHETTRYVPETDPLVLEKLEKWQDIKFGLLMHWGAYSQWGIVESWSLCSEDEGWCQRNMDNYTKYKEKYEDLQTTFNPTEFSPDKWADAAENAGMKYVIFTTKHHDGFCMFDTDYTDYKVTDENCPFHTHPKANITKEIFDAFRAKDFMVGAYFSKPDWHSDYYWWPYFSTPDRNVNYDPEKYPERWEKFVDFTHNQILELMTEYGDVDILWLDGGWVAKKSEEQIREAYERKLEQSENGFIKSRVVSQDIKMDELVEKCREEQPGLIVVDRAVPGPNQNYLTPENRVPEKTLPYPWESCIISGGGWSYTPDANYMSGRDAVHMLVDIVAKGGNLLLNVAPGPDGNWQQGAYDLLEQIGNWMDVNQEAIYDSEPIMPYKENNICMTRQPDGTVHYFYLAGPQEELPETVEIRSHKPVPDAAVTLLGADVELEWKEKEYGFEIHVPEELRNSPPCKYAWTFEVSGIQNDF